MNLEQFIEAYGPTEGEALKGFFVLLLIAVLCMLVAIMTRDLGIPAFRYNLFCIPATLYRMLSDFVFGKKYLVRINETWTVARGRKRKLERLFVFYGRDGHEWLLENGEWDTIEVTWDKERIQEEIIRKNISELKQKNPLKHQFDDNGPIRGRMTRYNIHPGDEDEYNEDE